jgi:hypothetical protein
MPSTPSTRLRVEKQALGENSALWGAPKLNAAIDRLEEGIAGVLTVAIAGTTTTLTSTNYSADQARYACLVFTGTLSANSTIVVPNVEKTYLIVNNSTQGAYSLTIKTAAGTGYALRPGPQQVFCDGTDVYRGTPTFEQLPVGQIATDSSGNVGIGYTTAPALTDTRLLSVKGPATGQGYGGVRVEAGINTKQGILQVSGSAGDVIMGCDPVTNTTGSAYIDAGGVASARFMPGGYVVLQGSIATTTTPGYPPYGTTLGIGLWGAQGRVFISQDQFSYWNTTLADSNFVVFAHNGTAVGGIGMVGATTAYYTSSDYRLKQGIEPMTEAVERLSKLRPSTFAFKSDPDRVVDGLIAHEVQEVCPYAVSGERDGEEMQLLDNSKLVPLLIGAVQELVRRVELLEDAV